MTWTVDPSHSGLQFSVRHLGLSSVRGSFHTFSGSVEFDPADPTRSSGTAEVEVASVDTADAGRDAHLRSPDFFDAERYPRITFHSTSVTDRGEGRYAIRGELTIRDVTREVELEAELFEPVTDPWGNRRIAVSLEGTIDRTQFGLQWNQVLEAGRLLVGEKVRISGEAELVEAAAQAVAA